eukprot:363986-Chlamydomonas_euryale.AAC.3
MCVFERPPLCVCTHTRFVPLPGLPHRPRDAPPPAAAHWAPLRRMQRSRPPACGPWRPHGHPPLAEPSRPLGRWQGRPDVHAAGLSVASWRSGADGRRRTRVAGAGAGTPGVGEC